MLKNPATVYRKQNNIIYIYIYIYIYIINNEINSTIQYYTRPFTLMLLLSYVFPLSFINIRILIATMFVLP